MRARTRRGDNRDPHPSVASIRNQDRPASDALSRQNCHFARLPSCRWLGQISLARSSGRSLRDPRSTALQPQRSPGAAASAAHTYRTELMIPPPGTTHVVLTSGALQLACRNRWEHAYHRGGGKPLPARRADVPEFIENRAALRYKEPITGVVHKGYPLRHFRSFARAGHPIDRSGDSGPQPTRDLAFHYLGERSVTMRSRCRAFLGVLGFFCAAR